MKKYNVYVTGKVENSDTVYNARALYIVHYTRVETKHLNNILLQKKKNYNETEHYYLTTKIKWQYIIYIYRKYVVKFE
jgi:hypothetical protein